jgi:hypothetical protein
MRIEKAKSRAHRARRKKESAFHTLGVGFLFQDGELGVAGKSPIR